MPYLRGEPLARRLKRSGPVEQAAAARLIQLLASALQVAHEAGILHRDLKPANVMISPEGEPVIMDFGLACQVNADDTRLTTSGFVIGTPAYVAPEQIGTSPDSLGPACDIYSLGVMLYKMLTGTLPFQGAVHEVLKQPSSRIRSRRRTGRPAWMPNWKPFACGRWPRTREIVLARCRNSPRPSRAGRRGSRQPVPLPQFVPRSRQPEPPCGRRPLPTPDGSWRSG
jgi:serine/threonine protein kinase